MKFAFYSLGCKTNQFETAALERLCREKGHSVVDFEQDADVYVINTCTVTGTGGRKSRTVIRRARRAARPDAIIAVCGCLGQTSPEQAAEAGADIVCGVSDRAAVIDRAEQLFCKGRGQAVFYNREPDKKFELLPAGGIEGRTRALLKVEDGCNNFCSYCIIPYARGRVRSISIAEARRQVEQLAAEGYCEAVVTGIEISSFGQDSGESLAELIREVCRAAGPNMRIRLGSLEPRTIDREFCRAISGLPNLCPHFHPALQSGCDSVLKRMNRKYDTARFFESVTLLREFFPNCAITTDMIVGFPGESEDEFAQTLEFIKKCEFSAMHIFPYSIRKGTPAAKMNGQLDRAEKDERAASAGRIAARMRREYLERQKGKTLSVLFERREGGAWHGHSENYCEVCVNSDADLKNKTVRVMITDTDGQKLSGEALTDY